jgi:aarF domain-containing kinase
MIEVAAASAALHVQRVRMQEAAKDMPTQWVDWERKDWTDALMRSMGGNSLQRFWVAARRLASLAALASPLVLLAPFSLVSTKAQNLSWDYALWGIEQAGPTFIKLIQWATTRQDMFSQEFCLHFGKLRDQTRGHSWKETRQILASEYGDDFDSWLQLEELVGSGCVAQVYKGRLLQPVNLYPKGTEIALKVQHPNIWQKVCVDFYILDKVAHFLESLPYLNLEYLSLRDTAQQFCNIMLPQLDLREEEAHLKRFNQDFATDEKVSFPEPIMATRKALLETYLHGSPILTYVNAPLEKRKELAKLGCSTTLKMIFLNDFVHGDLHPGNILVQDTGKLLKLCILDCGLVIEMGPDQHENVIQVLGAFARKNGRLAGQLMVDKASKRQASDLDVELFVEGIERICVEDEDNNFVEKVGDYIADICYLACKHKVKLEPSFVNAALAVEIMEGIASALDKTLKVQSIALPLIIKAEMMHRLPSFSILK